ncbi:MAG: YdeI/OmpD-associated family protein [Ignavibacteriales bacterium]|nr:YdeI/OmpD-associated family protein [Ignavibacteriales bacterium]
MPQKASVSFAHVEPNSRAEWRRWLARNHSTSPGIKLILHKKNSKKPRMTYDEAVEEALCFGWIDSKPNTLDETRYILHFNPRKSGSVWSQRNKERVKRLIQSGLMQHAGLSKIEAAKRDGSWRSLDKVERLEVPQDLRKALLVNREAQKHFKSFPNSSKKIILFWIQSAKRPETRAKRVKDTVAQAAKNMRANHYRQ